MSQCNVSYPYMYVLQAPPAHSAPRRDSHATHVLLSIPSMPCSSSSSSSSSTSQKDPKNSLHSKKKTYSSGSGSGSGSGTSGSGKESMSRRKSKSKSRWIGWEELTEEEEATLAPGLLERTEMLGDAGVRTLRSGSYAPDRDRRDSDR